MNGICALIRGQGASWLSQPYEELARGQASANQEAGPHQALDLPVS